MQNRLKLPTLAALAAGLTLAIAAPADSSAETRDPILVKYDKDKDGMLSPAERKAWMTDRRAAALKKYDKNKDGKLDKGERAALRKDRVADLIKALDTDKDGELSRREVGKARGIRYRRIKRGFDRIDADGNSSLTRAEIEVAISRMGERRRDRKKRRRAKGGAR